MRKILIAGAFILAVSQYACVHHHHRHDTGPDQMGEPPPQHHPEHDRMQKQPHNHPEQYRTQKPPQSRPEYQTNRDPRYPNNPQYRKTGDTYYPYGRPRP